jgi:DNA-directed RNA polymerase subunit beta
MKLAHSIKNKSGDEIAHSGRKLNAQILKEIQKAKITEIEVDVTDLEGAWAAADVVDTTTGEVLLEANTELSADKVSKILDSGVVEMSLFFPERDDVGTVISQTLKRDSVKTPQEALIEIYRNGAVSRHVLRPAQVRLLEGRPAEVQHQAVREPGRHQPR